MHVSKPPHHSPTVVPRTLLPREQAQTGCAHRPRRRHGQAGGPWVGTHQGGAGRQASGWRRWARGRSGSCWPSWRSRTRWCRPARGPVRRREASARLLLCRTVTKGPAAVQDLLNCQPKYGPVECRPVLRPGCSLGGPVNRLVPQWGARASGTDAAGLRLQAGCSAWPWTRARAIASRRCTTTSWRCCGCAAWLCAGPQPPGGSPCLLHQPSLVPWLPMCA